MQMCALECEIGASREEGDQTKSFAKHLYWFFSKWYCVVDIHKVFKKTPLIKVTYIAYDTESTQRESEVEAIAIRIVSRQTCLRNVRNSEAFGFCFLLVLKKQSSVEKKI